MFRIAKKNLSIVFNNAYIDYEGMTLTKVQKEDCVEYDLKKILKEWDGIEGISFSIKHTTDPTNFVVDEDDTEEVE